MAVNAENSQRATRNQKYRRRKTPLISLTPSTRAPQITGPTTGFKWHHMARSARWPVPNRQSSTPRHRGHLLSHLDGGDQPLCKMKKLQPRPIVQLHNLNRQPLGRAKKWGCQLFFFFFWWRRRTTRGVRRGGYVTEPQQRRARLQRRGFVFCFYFKGPETGCPGSPRTLGVCGVSNSRSLRNVLCGGVLG